ncbi:hypothetical protein MD484_g1263, partial [Candolleomyces efflorescens]
MAEKKPENPNPSLASLQSSTTITSTSPLITERKPPQKDFEAALATLQSRPKEQGAIADGIYINLPHFGTISFFVYGISALFDRPTEIRS